MCVGRYLLPTSPVVDFDRGRVPGPERSRGVPRLAVVGNLSHTVHTQHGNWMKLDGFGRERVSGSPNLQSFFM